ncbi:PH domain-containing protein, partial [Candidatus Bathyarchaeota archaeon]|nr:PH domain-containing protein [Candidatus Bathyarchaeota archaeon]
MAAAITLLSSIFTEISVRGSFFLSVGLSIIAFAVVTMIYHSYVKAYVKTFFYKVTDQFIFIRRGVFTNHEVTIPFSRIQNVSISQGLFDKRFGLHTVKIETAGSNASSKQGSILPEGYMAGIRNPAHIERMIEKLVHKYTQEPKVPGKLHDQVFEEKDLAFDEFIAYLLSKMREGDDVKNRIKELRVKAGLT